MMKLLEKERRDVSFLIWINYCESISADNRLEESQADSVAKQAAAAIRKRYVEKEREGDEKDGIFQTKIQFPTAEWID